MSESSSIQGKLSHLAPWMTFAVEERKKGRVGHKRRFAGDFKLDEGEGTLRATFRRLTAFFLHREMFLSPTFSG